MPTYQLYSYCLLDPVHRGAEGLVLVKLTVQEDLSGFFFCCLFVLKPHKQKKVIEEVLNSTVPDANADAVY